jgi:hypothetical protein
MEEEKRDSEVAFFKKDLDNDNSIPEVVKQGIVFKREEVGGKIRYSYTLYLRINPLDEDNLKAISYAKKQMENIINGMEVEDKVAILKAKEVEE